MRYRVVVGVMTGLSLLMVQAPAKAQQGREWFETLRTKPQPELWLNNHEKTLSENPEAVNALSRELLAESLRQSPQVSAYARPALEALLKRFPQPEITEARQPWPWSQGLLVSLVKNYNTLAAQKNAQEPAQENPSILHQQLNLCYALGIRTCQAEMLYLLGRHPQRLLPDRIASFVKGAQVAQHINHQPLSILNQAGLSAYADDLDEDTPFTDPRILLARAQHLQLPEVEATVTLDLAAYLWENDEAEFKDIVTLLQNARHQFGDPAFQVELLITQAKIENEHGQVAQSRANWVNALALLPATHTRQRISLLQKLSDSYMSGFTEGTQYILKAKNALPYLDVLLKELPSESNAHFKAQIQRVEILSLLKDNNANAERLVLQKHLLSLSQKAYWEEQADLATMLSRVGQSEKAQAIFENLLASTVLEASQQMKILNQSQSVLDKENAARWALRFMSSDDYGLRSVSVGILNRLKPTFLLPEMKALLQSDDARVRSNIIQVIWYTQGKAALVDLLPLLQDNDVSVRENVLGALIQANYVLPLNTLEKELSSPHLQIRKKILQLLYKQAEGKQKIIALATTAKPPLQEEALSLLYQEDLSEKELTPFLPLLFSSESRVRSQVEMLLKLKRPVGLSQVLIQLMLKESQPSDESVRVLAQWDITLALKQLAPWSTQSDQKKLAYAYLFTQAPREGAVQQSLLPLMDPKESIMVRTAAILALLPSQNKTAWHDFSELFYYPALGKTLPQGTGLYRNTTLNTLFPPCLPVSAIESAPFWLGDAYQDAFYLLKRWWLKTPVSLWNGSQCIAPHLFASEEKKRLKEKLHLLSQHRDTDVNKKVQQYLNALGSN